MSSTLGNRLSKEESSVDNEEFLIFPIITILQLCISRLKEHSNL